MTTIPTRPLPRCGPADYGPKVARLPGGEFVPLPHAVAPSSLLLVRGQVYRVQGWAESKPGKLVAVLVPVTVHTIEGQETLALEVD